MAYYTPVGAVLADEHALTLPRAQAVLAALRRHRDFEVLELRAFTLGDGSRAEVLVVEAIGDEIPEHNPHGIQYRERLQIIVEAAQEHVPGVYALRQGFPRLAHQHQTLRGSPAWLCLYFESALETLRSWTPERFLQRIQWWLAKSARGELHPADQPLENLFFATPYELVLPWNLDALVQAKTALEVRLAHRRKKGATFRLQPQSKDNDGEAVVFVEVTLDPVLAGAVGFNCATLGDLEDTLGVRGSTLLSALTPAVRALVGSSGIKPGVEQQKTLLLVHAPMRRSEGEAPESTKRYAFLLSQSPIEIGLATGALTKVGATVYSSEIHMQPEVHDEWRALSVESIDVVQEPTAALLRMYGGLSDPGPVGVFLGAGTLGSAVLSVWGRSGWGRWTVVDKDYVRPHNLARHVAFHQQVGMPKANVVADLHGFAVPGADAIHPIVADVMVDMAGEVAKQMATANLVIDGTAGVDYGRSASTQPSWPRHASIYLTPSGNASVALVEGSDRRATLRSLEAQSYRAVVQHDWGATHVELPTGYFWSGASCRDLSTVLAYPRVILHAGTIAEQLPTMLAQPTAAIRVWQQAAQGALEVHNVAASAEVVRESEGVTVLWDEGLEAELRQWRSNALPQETGGVLLGYWDFNRNSLTIAAALPAPRDSLASEGGFERGVEDLERAVKEASRRTGGMLGYVGEWHSHPRGHTSRPSADDVVQLVYLALGMAEDGLPAAQMIIGERDVNISLIRLIAAT